MRENECQLKILKTKKTKKKSQCCITNPEHVLRFAAMHSGVLSPRMFSWTVRLYSCKKLYYNSYSYSYITHIVEGCDHVTNVPTKLKNEPVKRVNVPSGRGWEPWTKSIHFYINICRHVSFCRPKLRNFLLLNLTYIT